MAHIQLAVPVAIGATQVAMVVGVRAGAGVEGVGIKCLLLRGDGDERFEDGAGGVLPLDGAVEEGGALVL